MTVFRIQKTSFVWSSFAMPLAANWKSSESHESSPIGLIGPGWILKHFKAGRKTIYSIRQNLMPQKASQIWH